MPPTKKKAAAARRAEAIERALGRHSKFQSAPDPDPVEPETRKKGKPAAAYDRTPVSRMEIEWRRLDQLTPYEKNPRLNASAVPKVAKSLTEFGWRQPIVIDTAGVIVAGHTRYLAARSLGWETVPVHVARDLSPAQAKAYRLADNRTGAEAEWDLPLLRTELLALQADGADLEGLGFDPDELEGYLDAPTGLQPGADPDAIPERPAKPTTKPGQLITLGRHRLLCGDAMDPAAVRKLLAGAALDSVITDPPYCSGGFQESGRAKGSIGTGTRIKPRIKSDQLSTRGFQQLMRRTVFATDAPTVYVFLDWRQWANLSDLAEGAGYGVRSMIVWDKGTAGMGRGWRSQHELILYATKAVVDFDNKKAIGNVRNPSCTGNKHHPTEKPVELITDILGVMDMAQKIYDPFGGSGTTLLGAEMLGRSAYLMELDPGFCDVIAQRWTEATGGKVNRS